MKKILVFILLAVTPDWIHLALGDSSLSHNPMAKAMTVIVCPKEAPDEFLILQFSKDKLRIQLGVGNPYGNQDTMTHEIHGVSLTPLPGTSFDDFGYEVTLPEGGGEWDAYGFLTNPLHVFPFGEVQVTNSKAQTWLGATCRSGLPLPLIFNPTEH